MEGIVIAVLNSLGYIVVAALGLIGGRKLIGPDQARLVSTLRELLDAQEKKLLSLNDKLDRLEKEVLELKALTIFQAKKIEELTTALTEALKKAVIK